MRVLNLVRSATFSFLASVLLMSSLETTAVNATQSRSTSFWAICIQVTDLSEDLVIDTRNDLAERVRRAVMDKIAAVDGNNKRKVSTWPGCIAPNQPGFDRQLSLNLSVKSQKIKLDGRDWNVVVAGGVSADGLFQDRDTQPVLVVQEESVSEDIVAGALVEFVDRTIVALLRKR